MVFSRRSAITMALVVSAIGAYADSLPCTLFMAPSSTVDDDEQNDHFKLGIYAGVDIHPGSIIGIPDIAIPIFDLNLHSGEDRSDEFLEEVSNFMWTPEAIHANFEIFPGNKGESYMNVAIPGIGALVNQHFTSFVNAELDDKAVLDRVPMFETKDDSTALPPTRGANSQYYGVTLKSKYFIPAGMEILMSGLGVEEDENYLLGAEDFVSVDKSLGEFHRFFTKYEKEIDPDRKVQIYNYLVNDAFKIATHRRILEQTAEDAQEAIDHIMNLFPENPQDVEQFLQEGGAFVAEFPETKKSRDWILEHGQCMDGLYPGKSTIPGAEKGAFARRDVKEGELISPSPLFMIPHRDYLDMYPMEVKGDGLDQYAQIKLPRRDPETKQLLLNYCLGHPESSLLFYPYGMGVNLINHLPTGNGANAKIVWSNASFYDDELFEVLAGDLAEDFSAVLPIGIDIVATRDISANEEVFIDYGEEWQRAWDEHVKGWDSDRNWPKEALELNFEQKQEPFDTLSERQDKGNPMPENIMTACHIVISEDSPSQLVNGTKVFSFDEENTKLTGGNFKLCDIIERNSSGTKHVYTVKIHQVDAEDAVITNVPQSHIRYVDKPYQSTMHKPYTFRHPIQIPDEIFPLSWRNLKEHF